MITSFPKNVVCHRANDINMPLWTTFREEKTKQTCSSVGLPPPGRGAVHPRLAREESKGGGQPPWERGAHNWHFWSLYEKQNLPHNCHHPLTPAFQEMQLPIRVTQIFTCLYECLWRAGKVTHVTLG